MSHFRCSCKVYSLFEEGEGCDFHIMVRIFCETKSAANRICIALLVSKTKDEIKSFQFTLFTHPLNPVAYLYLSYYLYLSSFELKLHFFSMNTLSYVFKILLDPSSCLKKYIVVSRYFYFIASNLSFFGF